MQAHAEGIHIEYNQLLRALPRVDCQRLLPDLKTVLLEHGRVLFEAHERIAHVYFPQHCVVSLLALVGDGSAGDVAIVGNEGVVGLGAFLGATAAARRAVSQIPDDARRMTVRAFRRALSDGVVFRHPLLRYTRTILRQMSQCAPAINVTSWSNAVRAGCSWRTTV